MNRVLSILAAASCLAANVGAAPVPNHQQPQAKNSAIPMAPRSAQNPDTTRVQRLNQNPTRSERPPGMASNSTARPRPAAKTLTCSSSQPRTGSSRLGTFVKVTNLKNGKWIIVRVNDRGPYVGNRIMDLSYSAARMLNFRDGVERIRIDLIQPENVAMNRGY